VSKGIAIRAAVRFGPSSLRHKRIRAHPFGTDVYNVHIPGDRRELHNQQQSRVSKPSTGVCEKNAVEGIVEFVAPALLFSRVNPSNSFFREDSYA
jgi:hypothetical protein